MFSLPIKRGKNPKPNETGKGLRRSARMNKKQPDYARKSEG